jgi:anti-sigma regulatory factor (Ser/Thr protein kinase)
VQRILAVRIAGGPDAPRRARSALHALDGQLGSLSKDVALLVSELVTNAVTHAKAQVVGLCVLRLDGDLRVEITAPGPAFEPPAGPRPDYRGGFGFHLIAQLAKDWGVAREASETRVWFEVASS